jgi:hypothetical protein
MQLTETSRSNGMDQQEADDNHHRAGYDISLLAAIEELDFSSPAHSAMVTDRWTMSWAGIETIGNALEAESYSEASSATVISLCFISITSLN